MCGTGYSNLVKVLRVDDFAVEEVAGKYKPAKQRVKNVRLYVSL